MSEHDHVITYTRTDRLLALLSAEVWMLLAIAIFVKRNEQRFESCTDERSIFVSNFL